MKGLLPRPGVYQVSGGSAYSKKANSSDRERNPGDLQIAGHLEWGKWFSSGVEGEFFDNIFK